jgi:predicted RNase H-like HicB family nuclease
VNNITIRFSDGVYFASVENTELEGTGETLSEALRDLAENIELVQI